MYLNSFFSIAKATINRVAKRLYRIINKQIASEEDFNFIFYI